MVRELAVCNFNPFKGFMSQHYGLSWLLIPVYLKRMYILLIEGILPINESSNWLTVFQVFYILLLLFFFWSLFSERWLLKSPTIITVLSISLLNFIRYASCVLKLYNYMQICLGWLCLFNEVLSFIIMKSLSLIIFLVLKLLIFLTYSVKNVEVCLGRQLSYYGVSLILVRLVFNVC